MARRVFVHIGAPKTGTTFLQTVMWNNRSVLRDQGILYPLSRRFDYYRLYERVRGLSSDSVDPERVWTEMLGEVTAWRGDAFLSHEFLGAASAEEATWAIKQFAPAEVHVIFTARDYVRQFPGVWLEALKMGSGRSFDEFIEGALAFEENGPWSWLTQDAPAILARWSHSIPNEHVHVITVPPRGAPRDQLWHRWGEVLGIDSTPINLDVALPNDSLGAPQAALLARVQPYLSGRLEEKPGAYRWFRAYFAQEVLVAQEGPRFGLRPEHAERFAELSREAARAIGHAGYQVTGTLADLDPVIIEDSTITPGDVSDADMLDVAARAIERMLHDMQTVTAHRDEWREQAKAATRAARDARVAARRAKKAVVPPKPPPPLWRKAASKVRKSI